MTQLYYEIKGNINKPKIVFLHGFMGSTKDWKEIVNDLCDQFCCLIVDLPGHGKSEILQDDENYKIDSTSSSLIKLLEQLKIKKSVLVGYSMGGRVAIYIALNYPQYFTRLILDSASTGLASKKERMERRAKDKDLAQKLETTIFSEFIKDWYNTPLFKTLWDHPNFDKLLEIRLDNRPKELAKSLKNIGVGTQPSLWEKWPENQIPTLLIVGEYDIKFRNIAERMVKKNKTVILKVIQNSGHNTHFEAKTEFIESIMNFLH